MKRGIIALYVVIFWFLLPAALTILTLAIGGGPLHFQPDRIGVAALSILGAIIFIRGASELFTVGKGLPISALPPTTLTVTGPYSWFRHPLYIGYQLILLPLAVIWIEGPEVFVSFGVMLLVGWLVYSYIEERALVRRFGAGYIRYKSETPLLTPRLATVARLLVRVIARMLFRTRVRGYGEIPKDGAVVFIGLHRCYFDPFFIGSAVDRTIHFLTTESMFRSPMIRRIFTSLGAISLSRYTGDPAAIRAAGSIVRSGGCIGLFPDGGRTWFGEIACDTAAYRFIELLEREGAVIVTVEIDGAFECYPRVSQSIRRTPVTIRFRRTTAPIADEVEAMATRIRNRETLRAAAGAMYRKSTSGFEALFPVCPNCGGFTTIAAKTRGGSSRSGDTLACSRCKSAWKITVTNGVVTENTTPFPLTALESDVHRGLALVSDRALPFEEIRGKPGTLFFGDDAARIVFSSNNALDHENVITMPYATIQAVVIEGRCRMEVYTKEQIQRTQRLKIRFEPRYALAAQYLLRIRAFGSPYIRIRGTDRHRIDSI